MEKALLGSLEKVKEIFQAEMGNLTLARRLPISTYRLQFNRQFTFSQAKGIVSYLHELGISDVYASPYFMAKEGSLHGYDILNHNRLNPEIGTEEDFQDFIEELRKYGLGQILDIVPNHMSISGKGNAWWQDVLENGPGSLYADFFDIDWKPIKPELENKVLLPILGDQYGLVLENQELTLQFEEGTFSVLYGDQKLPLDPVSVNQLLKFHLEDLEERMGKEHPDLNELFSIITALEHLPRQTEKNEVKVQERRREKEIIKKRISALFDGNTTIRAFIDENVKTFNGEKGESRSFDLLDELLKNQAYLLSHWRVATEEINYRRFFDINELAAIRVEALPVFQETHKLIFDLIREKKVTGLRVDHPDGLYNPIEYFYRLQKGCFIRTCLKALEQATPEKEEAAFSNEAMGKEFERLYEEELSRNPSSPLRTPFYIVGEKILMSNERLPEEWPIFGTVGYGFLNSVNGLFVDAEKTMAFEGIYHRFIGMKMNYSELVYEKKKLIMLVAMSAEINTLAHYLNRLSEKNRHTRDFTLDSLRTAITEVTACFPVYRTYVHYCAVTERDRRYIEQAVTKAMRKNPVLSATIFNFLKNILLLHYPEGFEEADKMAWLDFVLKFQQVTGPVMAKGVEDTVFYVYNRLVSLNDVGGNPDKFGTLPEAFHGQNIERTKFWPSSLITTATHDNKRGEDVRARINVLSEIPDQWRESLGRWRRMNKKKKTLIDGQWAPDPNEEYLLYQTLLGSWPLIPDNELPVPFIERVASSLFGAWPFHPENEAVIDLFKKRIKEYMLKALREAKIHSSWINPHLVYEEALLQFIDTLLSPSPDNVFLKDFEALQQRTAYLGMFNSLSQTLLKITSPGTSDFYQGTELWDFSLADPDNRRPVDFKIRQGMLKALKKKMGTNRKGLTGLVKELLRNWRDGRIKLYLIFQSLNFRRKHHQLFAEGAYLPLLSDGNLKNHVCAFARQGGGQIVIAIVPRLLTHLVPGLDALPTGKVWEDSRIILPDEISGAEFQNIFTGETLRVADWEGKRALPLQEVLANFPCALLEMI